MLIQVHFSPVAQPVCATGLQAPEGASAMGASMMMTSSPLLPPPQPAAERSPIIKAPKASFLIVRTPVLRFEVLARTVIPPTRAELGGDLNDLTPHGQARSWTS